MNKLTKKQLEYHRSFYTGRVGQVLHNGEVGYCKAKNTVVVCCSNCGDYKQFKLDEII